MLKTVKILKAVAEQNRVKILLALNSRPACVCELVWVLGISQPNLSHHLRILEEAGLLERKRDGNWIEYKLISDPLVVKIIEFIKFSTQSDALLQHEIQRLEKINRNQICEKEGNLV